MSGSLILVNGASSAGKTSLCRALQPMLVRAFMHYGLDLILFGDVLPRDADRRPRDWLELRPRVVEGFRRSLRGFLDAGVDVLCDHVVESSDDRDRMVETLQGIETFWVGLHVPLPVLQERERERGDRRVGDARRDLEVVHSGIEYDLELDGTDLPQVNARRVVAAWSFASDVALEDARLRQA